MSKIKKENMIGFDKNGIHEVTKGVFDQEGFDRDGYNSGGFDHDGFDYDGFDRDGYNSGGFDHDGFDYDGFDRDGYDKYGFNLDEIHKVTGTKYNEIGFNKKGALSKFQRELARDEMQNESEDVREVESLGKETSRKEVAGEKNQTIELSDEHKKMINKFIPSRFANIHEFLTRAIEVMLAWEENPETAINTFSKFPPTMNQFAFMSDTMPPEMIKEAYREYPERFGDDWKQYLKENPKTEEPSKKRRDGLNYIDLIAHRNDAINFVDNENFENKINDEIKYDGWPLLFTHYSRILPAKIGLMVLAEIMRENKSKIVSLEQFMKEAHDIAEEIAKKYLEIEKNNPELKRVKKISIGLPKPHDKNVEITSEQAIKEQRYKDRNFGKVKKSKEGTTFEGLMSALGLIKVFEKNNEIQITFSEKGKKMYLMKNPIFQETDDPAFSPDEQDFVINDLISKRELEYNLVKVAKETIKNSKDEENTIKYIEDAFLDEIKKFTETCSDSNIVTRLEKMVKMTEDTIRENLQNKDRKQTAIEAVRIATLGRMAELGVIDWNADKEGKSRYTIAKKN